MADTPTSESKAKAEDRPARADAGQDRERRRGGKGKGKGRGSDASGGRDDRPKRDDRPRRDDRRDDRRREQDRRSEQPLTAGLFAGVADREMPCRIAGCSNTWTWFGTQQIRSLGKPEPKRMCADHLATFEGIDDRQMPCRNTWCTNTWAWSRGAQLYQRERQDKLKPPHRLCDQCFEEDKTTEDTALECKIPECKNTWIWERQAQLRHRAWVRRQQAKIDADEAEDAREHGEQVDAGPDEAAPTVEVTPAIELELATEVEIAPEVELATEVELAPVDSQPGAEEQDRPGRKRRRKRRRKRKVHDGPPEKLCERCFERLGHLEPIEVPCKVHGCTTTWTWERDGQLRAWAGHDGQANLAELPQPPRRMCNSCFEFVRHHTDREVACGRPGCAKSWTYKTGAQLQDFLAGRTQDPVRMCEECSRSQFTISSVAGVPMPEGAEVMPCMVAGCSGSWVYAPGMKLSAADPEAEEPPVDRMCDDCRIVRGVEGRDPRRAAPAEPGPEQAAEQPASPEAAPEAAPETE